MWCAVAATLKQQEDRAIRRLALSRGITFFGGNASFWALSAILYQQSHSPTLVAAAALASFSVPAALSPLAGLIGDRFDRRQVMIASELSGAFIFLAMALVVSPVALIGLRVVASVACAPMVPATSAALPGLVADDQLDRANAAVSKAGTAGCLVGTAFAGLMLATAGGSWVFVANVVTFLISAWLIASVKGDFRPTPSDHGRRLAAGFSFLRRSPILRPVTLAYGLIFIGIGVSIPAEIVVASEFGAGSLGFAGLIFLWGVGMLLGAAAAERLSGHVRDIRVLSLAAVALAVGFLAVGAAPIFAVALMGMALGGVGEGLWEPAQNSLIQRRTPDGIRGRVLAGNEAVMQAGIAVGLLASGFVTSAAGASAAFTVAGGAAAIGTALLLGVRPNAELIATPPPTLRPLAEARVGLRRTPSGTPPSQLARRSVSAAHVSSAPELRPTT